MLSILTSEDIISPSLQQALEIFKIDVVSQSQVSAGKEITSGLIFTTFMVLIAGHISYHALPWRWNFPQALPGR
jgi:hypothetical protein